MVDWYKHDILAWMDGTASLSSNAYRAYHVICQLIYLAEEPIAATNERFLAGSCNLSVRAFRAALDELISAQKLTLENDKISNSRASAEIFRVEKNRENARKGGERSGEVRQPDKKLNGFNGHDEASLQHPRSLLDETRLDKKESSPVAKKKATRTEVYSERFEKEFWEPYPRKTNTSKKDAWREWQKLTPEQQSDACLALPAFQREVRDKDQQYIVHGCRFLSQHRFESFVANGTTIVPAFDIRKHLV